MLFLKGFYLVLFIGITHCSHENGTSTDEFIPSNEWQIVKPGQKLPPGLHIRSDFKTGVTEAKIIDKNDKSETNSAVTLAENSDNFVNDTNAQYSPDQLKRMLKGIKDDGPKNENIEINGTKFRSYEELKKDFETLQMSIKSDLEIIRELMDELKTNPEKSRILAILGDLEYYLHQIDNGQNFVDMGGLRFLHQFLEYDDPKLQSEALRCLSSALQGNAKVKVEAMKNGTLSRLLLQLKSTTDSRIINQILVAISALTRQFPIAQLAFVNGGGLQITGDIFDRFKMDDDEKISVRLITLISDWLKERNAEEQELTSSVDGVPTDRLQQYRKVGLEAVLPLERWCQRIAHAYTARPHRSIDFLDKILSSIGTAYPICHRHLDHDRLTMFLENAVHTLTGLVALETDDFYFRDLLVVARDALVAIETRRSHTEL